MDDDAPDAPLLALAFEAEVIHWRGPSPFFFVPVPPAQAAELRRIAPAVTYGWGMIPVTAEIAGVGYTTALFPKAGTYYLPVKDLVRRRTEVTAGDVVAVAMTVHPPRR